MSNRLPSMRQFANMSEHDRWSILERFASDLRDEHAGILTGDITPWGRGVTRRSILASARQRLKRVYAVADECGLYVGQPVPADSREAA